MLRKSLLPALLAVSCAAAGSAQAALTVAKHKTRNVTCESGVCTATAADAILNVKDLRDLLAASDVTLVSGSMAQDIALSAEFAWTSASHLTVDAWRGIAVTKPVTSEGAGGVTLTTNDGGTGGDYVFQDQGRIAFWDLGSALVINGVGYTLVNSVASLAAAIDADAKDSYALANNYDAAPDGTYLKAPVRRIFRGTFEGLGHSIANLSISVAGRRNGVGLFAQIQNGVARDIRLVDVNIHDAHGQSGALAGVNSGTILHAGASGTIVLNNEQCMAGGLVGLNSGTISLSSAAVSISDNKGGCMMGGLVGQNLGLIDRSFATGAISNSTFVGGLVGYSNSGSVRQSYATGAVTGGSNDSSSGGLVGTTAEKSPGAWGSIVETYSIGHVTGDGDTDDTGGLIGYDSAPAGFVSGSYWDLQTSGISDPSQGAGHPQNDPGIAGLTTAALKAALPAGFDPAVWGQSAAINGGYPYLLANPPQ